jgi:indolepyruvate ferredoxin oxidoreductase
MVTDPSVTFPPTRDIVERIGSRTRREDGCFLDAHALTTELFGDDQCANVLLLGVALQEGLLPVGAAELEQAITLNGVAVQRDLQALRRGRQFVSDPDALRAAIEVRNPPPVPKTPSASVRATADLVRSEDDAPLRQLVLHRISELSAYQDSRYARRYARAVERVRAAEVAAVPGATELADTVARRLFTLMAYKDEYEVARLSLDPALAAEVRAEFGDDATYSFRLHPPALRALGMRQKLTLGRWFRGVFAVLYAMRHLRGTPFDPFGRSTVRRVERQLVDEYESLVDRIAADVQSGSHRAAIDLADAPQLVRGYEGIKLANVDRYRPRLIQLTKAFEGAGGGNG